MSIINALTITRNPSIPLTLRKKLGKCMSLPLQDFTFKIANGCAYAGHTRNHTDKKVYQYGAHEAATIRLIRRLLKQKQDSVYMDVGVNTGFHLIATSDCWARAYAFEPNPNLFSVLDKQISNNQLHDRVCLYHAGLSDQEATLFFELPGAQNQGEGKFVSHQTDQQLPVHHAGALCARDGIIPDVIKIDVEGHEENVLTGLSDLLRSHQPAVIFEYNDHSKGRLDQAGVLQNLFGDAYRFYGILPSREYPKLVPFQFGKRYENVLAITGDLPSLT